MEYKISFYNPTLFNKTYNLSDSIRNKIKTVEGRKNSLKYQNIKKNDIIIFELKNEPDIKVLVIYVNKYKNVKEYLLNETLEKTLPGVDNIEEGIKIYEQFNPSQIIEKYGFLGIGIKLI